MANKSSSIAKKLWLANGSAVLAIASLFSIGFSAWAEVGGEATADIDGININVSNHGAKMLAFDYKTFYLYDTGIMQNADDREYTTTPYFSFLAVFEINQVDVNRNISCTFDLSCPEGFEPGMTSYVSSSGVTNVSYKCKTIFYPTSTNHIPTIDDLKKNENFASKNFEYPPPESNTYTFINSTTLFTDAYLHFYLEWNVKTPSNYIQFYNAVNALTSLTFNLKVGAEII